MKTLAVTFSTTSQAMVMEEFCKNNNSPGRLIPIPNEISAGCGLAWKSDLEDENSLIDFLENSNVHYEKIYILDL